MRDLTKGNITTTIVRFAIPIFFSYMLQLSYSLADTRLVGSCLGEMSLAAVGASVVLFNLNMNFWMGCANGFGVVIARYFGAKDTDKVRKAFAGGLFLGLSTTTVIMGLELLFINQILAFLNVPENLLETAKIYIVVIIAGSLFITLYDLCTAALRAIGDSLTPLVILLLSVVFNILGDVVFLVVLGTGVWGAALATILSQFMAALICWLYMMKRYELFHIKLEDLLHLELSMLKDMYALGMSMGFMSSLVNFGTLALQTSINTLGEEIIVAHTAARKATEFLMSMFSVFGQSMATFCGQNYGARDFDRIRKGLKSVYLMAGIWCLLVALLAWTVSPWMIYTITGSTNPNIIEPASRYLKFDTIFYFITAVICVDRNALQGMNEKMIPLFSSGIEMVMKMLFATTLVPRMGYWGVIITEPVVWAVMVIPLVVRKRKLLRIDGTTTSQIQKLEKG